MKGHDSPAGGEPALKINPCVKGLINKENSDAVLAVKMSSNDLTSSTKMSPPAPSTVGSRGVRLNSN